MMMECFWRLFWALETRQCTITAVYYYFIYCTLLFDDLWTLFSHRDVTQQLTKQKDESHLRCNGVIQICRSTVSINTWNKVCYTLYNSGNHGVRSSDGSGSTCGVSSSSSSFFLPRFMSVTWGLQRHQWVKVGGVVVMLPYPSWISETRFFCRFYRKIRVLIY